LRINYKGERYGIFSKNNFCHRLATHNIHFNCFFLLLFKKQIGNFISRVNSVSKNGINANQSIIDSQNDEKKNLNVDQLLSIESSIMLQELETSINDDLLKKGLNTDGNTVKILIKHLAYTQIELEFEKIYNLIFGSQIYLLKKLNETSSTGKPLQFAEEYFVSVQEKYDLFKDWDTNKYLSFLLTNLLIIFDNNIVSITIKGNEFLSWLMKRGKFEEKVL
jgi:hypothetical protein